MTGYQRGSSLNSYLTKDLPGKVTRTLELTKNLLTLGSFFVIIT